MFSLPSDVHLDFHFVFPAPGSIHPTALFEPGKQGFSCCPLRPVRPTGTSDRAGIGSFLRKLDVVEIAPLPFTLTLAAPAVTPEKIAAENGDFPFLPTTSVTTKGAQRIAESRSPILGVRLKAARIGASRILVVEHPALMKLR
jgi:hypothetical protein